MDDLISRQTAIDAIYKIEGYLDWDARGEVSDVLSLLPSVQPARVWHPVTEPPKHHNDVIVRGVEAIGNVVVHKVMQWDVDTWRPTDYAPSVIWKEWSEI